jgi:LysR family transcriptional regulator of beta-lactamase
LLLPSIVEAFGRLTETLNRFEDGRYQDVITVGVVGTFASGWLLPRLDAFRKAYPRIDLRLFTNNNRIDIAGEGLDYAIRFGDGLWHGTEATHLIGAPFTPFCAPEVPLGDYWITSLHSRQPSPAMLSFKNWLLETIAAKQKVPAIATRSKT